MSDLFEKNKRQRKDKIDWTNISVENGNLS